MAAFLATSAEPDRAQRWRQREQRSRTPITSDHPCLADRLASLGLRHLLNSEDPPAPVPLEQSAISLLGDCRARLWQLTNASWKVLAIERWRAEHASAKQFQEKRDAAAKSDAPLTPEKLWERIQREAEFSPPDQALSLVRGFLAEHPDHAAANFSMARLLLEQDDDASRHHFDLAMGSTDFLAPSLHMLLDYYRDAGRDEEAEPIRLRLAEYERNLAVARKERFTVSRRDRFSPHDLAVDQLEQIRRILSRYPQVQMAYLARKQVQLFTDKPSYILAIRRRARLFEETRSADRFLTGVLASQISVPCAVVIMKRSRGSLAMRMLRVCPSPIFQTTP
jgi:hypothetical protein